MLFITISDDEIKLLFISKHVAQYDTSKNGNEWYVKRIKCIAGRWIRLLSAMLVRMMVLNNSNDRFRPIDNK